MTGTQFLQVPKALPHGHARSRSKSRSRGSVTEVMTCSVDFKPGSPPRTKAMPERLRLTTVPSDSQSSHEQTKPRSTSPPVPPKMQIDTCIPIRQPISIPPQPTRPNHDTTVKTTPDSPLQHPSPWTSFYEDTYTFPSPTPPPKTPLRQKLIGTWKLESYIAYPTPNSHPQRPTYPMTRNVTGFLMYTPDGYMCAQMLIPGQQSFKRGEGEEPQWAEAGKRCFSYGGPYYVTNEGEGREEVLRHTFQVCNLPGWVGDIQVRTHRFEEEEEGETVLFLGSEEPTEIKGDKRIPVLKWRRARDNSEGVPPPPMPQIKISGPGEP